MNGQINEFFLIKTIVTTLNKLCNRNFMHVRCRIFSAKMFVGCVFRVEIDSNELKYLAVRIIVAVYWVIQLRIVWGAWISYYNGL